MTLKTMSDKLEKKTVKELSDMLTEKKIKGRSKATTKQAKISLLLETITIIDPEILPESEPKKVKRAKNEPLEIGDIVRLKPGIPSVEVNDYHSQPYHFDQYSVGKIIFLDSPCVRYRAGKSDTQTIVEFRRGGNRLIVRIDNADLEVCEATVTLLKTITQSDILTLIENCKMCGRLYNSGILHPFNNPGIESIDCLNGVQGLIVASEIRTRSTYLFHLSQMNREIAFYDLNLSKS